MAAAQLPIWKDPETQRGFHQSTFRLAGLARDTSLRELGTPPPPDDTDYTLSRDDELKLANHVAFLAQTHEGVETISGVCLEETGGGLIIRLASNEAPKRDTIATIQNIMDGVSRYASQEAGMNRGAFLEVTLEQVLKLGESRIMGRIRPEWHNPPAYRKKKPPLSTQLADIWQTLRPLRRRFPETGKALENLLERLQSFEARKPQASLATIVQAAFQASASPPSANVKSLAAKINSCGSLGELADSRAVREVDQLGRYFSLCRDLAVLGRHYRHLLRKIEVRCCERFAPRTPLGAPEFVSCHVHAEVQLVLWYERNDTYPPPRAIGCSKSACFLCCSLITKTGYVVSSTHGKLYPQWTLPDITIERNKALHLRWVIDEIHEEVKRHSDRQHINKSPTKPESVAESYLSGPSTPTQLSQTILQSDFPPRSPSASQASPTSPEAVREPSGIGLPLQLPDTQQKETRPTDGSNDLREDDTQAPSSAMASEIASTVHLEEDDLHEPFVHHLVENATPNFILHLGHLTLLIDCSSVSVGRLTVSRAPKTTPQDAKAEAEAGVGPVLIRAIDVPTTKELNVDCPVGSDVLKYQMICFDGITVDIEVLWGIYPGWKEVGKGLERRVATGMA